MTLLAEVAQIHDCEHKTAPITPGGGYFAVGTPAMRGNAINLNEAREIDEETYKAWTRRSTPRAGDILFAREAPVGPVVRIPLSQNVAPGQRTVLLQPDSAKVDSSYLYYLLASPSVQTNIAEKSAGSTVHHLNVADVRALPLGDLPSLCEQRAIGEVLGALDDKIAANRQVVSRARSLAAALLDRAIAAGASVRPLGDLVIFHNRRRVPLSANERAERRGSVPYYGANGALDTVDEALFDEVLVLVGEDGTVLTGEGRPVVQYVWGPAWVNNHAHVLVGEGIPQNVLRHLIARSPAAHIVTGAVQPKISMGALKGLLVEVPDDRAMSSVSAPIEALGALERAMVDENRALATTRDELLPLLMSGRITVKDAEKTVEGVV